MVLQSPHGYIDPNGIKVFQAGSREGLKIRYIQQTFFGLRLNLLKKKHSDTNPVCCNGAIINYNPMRGCNRYVRGCFFHSSVLLGECRCFFSAAWQAPPHIFLCHVLATAEARGQSTTNNFATQQESNNVTFKHAFTFHYSNASCYLGLIVLNRILQSTDQPCYTTVHICQTVRRHIRGLS